MILVSQLLPRVVLAVAVVLFSDCGSGFDVKVGSVLEQRFSGLEGSDGVAGVDGVEVPGFEALAEEFGLCPAGFV